MNQAKQHLEDLSSALSYNKGEYDKFTLDMRESAELEFSKLKISANEGSSSSSSSGASSSATGSSLPTISELPDLNAQADPQTWSSKVIN